MNVTTPLPPGLLLDLDDTILTYEAVAGAAWRATCEQHAGRCGVSPEHLDAVLHEVRRWYWGDPERHRLGRLRLEEARAEAVHLALQRLNLDDRDLAALISTDFRDRRDRAMGFFPGARETLEELRRRGVRLGLVTNGQSHLQRAKLRRFDLEPLFEVICVEGEMGFGKPDPRAYTHALAGLGLPADEVWMVGDNLEWDVAGAQGAGVRGIWHDYRRRGLPADTTIIPHRIVHALSDLLA